MFSGRRLYFNGCSLRPTVNCAVNMEALCAQTSHSSLLIRSKGNVIESNHYLPECHLVLVN